jgi:hypothetical protein
MSPVNRPTSVFVIAILQFIFGGIGVLFYGCSGLMQASGVTGPAGNAQAQEKMQQDLEAAMEKRMPGIKTINIAIMFLEVAISILMIVGGIGLVKMAPWGRKLTIAYGFLSLIMKGVNIVLGVMVTVPATKEAMASMSDQMQMPAREAAAFGQIMELFLSIGAFTPICFAIYPIVVLVFMFRPTIAAAFSGVPMATAPADYDDRYRPSEPQA